MKSVGDKGDRCDALVKAIREEGRSVAKEDQGVDQPERYYADDEDEFIKAVDAYKKKHKVKFPTATDFLRVAKELGYQKIVFKAVKE